MLTTPYTTNGGSAAWSKRFDGVSAEFTQWRSNRLKRLDEQLKSADSPIYFGLSAIASPSVTMQTLCDLCDAVMLDGYALYQWTSEPENTEQQLAQLHRHLGLEQTDGGVLTSAGEFSVLEDLSGAARGRFIPYSNRAMGWHTDGYYNDETAQVRCFTLHCTQPAANGGELTLLDTELLLIALLDDDPSLVDELSHPQAMTLPANSDQEGHNRPDRTVPVLFENADGTLGTRFTTRLKNISWRSANTQSAAVRALELIDQHQHWHTRIKLESGQGIITRNILHRRDAFLDAPGAAKRRMLRGRYLQLPRTEAG